MHLLGIVAIIYTIYQLIKEALEPRIPAENWANKDLIHEDRMSGISEKEFAKNLAAGKYKLTESYPEPHRNKHGKIIIENCKLYEEDLEKYGVIQTHKWVNQGKYNLTPEELEKERERIKKEFKYLND